ncbi:hypothetical protein [Ensifer sp.]|uniref:hypothetical protein n=1 Tax=Ensifer sp. TaxID=1872086 RepID=UPI00289CCBD1|nr:hypothetical protein [Ensifer sp.]
MGLVTEHAPGVSEFSERKAPTLREVGERGRFLSQDKAALAARILNPVWEAA